MRLTPLSKGIILLIWGKKYAKHFKQKRVEEDGKTSACVIKVFGRIGTYSIQ